MMHPDQELMIRLMILAGAAAAMLELFLKLLRPALHMAWLELLF